MKKYKIRSALLPDSSVTSVNSRLTKSAAYLILLLSTLVLGACGGGGSGVGSPVPNDTPPAVVEGTSISQFSFLKSDNPELENDVVLDIENRVITGRIPFNVDVDNLVASFEHDGSEVTINDAVQVDGTTANDFTDLITYTVNTSDDRQGVYQVDLTKFTGLPVIYLSTDANAEIVSKENYIDGDVWVDGGRGFDDLAATPMEIRGRGNSTWFLHPKKPFQMKLNDKGVFLGMPRDKKWLFLAEYSDKTLLRNTIAFEMGYISNLDWTPQSTFAEVYLNNEYNGTYNITQKVEEGDDRVALGDTGYLLEIDQLNKLDPDDVYFYTDEFLINIKEPSVVQDSAEYDYVKDLVKEFESVLFSAGFKDPLTGYASYIDLDSFIDWYLISEITKNVDSQFFSSMFLNVIPGEKIKMGPLWDFDLSFGNIDYADPTYPERFWVKYHSWYDRLFQDEAFVEKIKTRFAYFRDNQDFILDKIDSYANKLEWAQQENDDKWETLGIYVWPNPIVFDTYDEEVDHLKSWYTKRMDWLDNAFNNL